MRKKIGTLLSFFVIIVALQAQGPPQQQSQMAAEEVKRALSLVEKPKPAPDNVKAGLEAITATDSMAMLTYIASDWTKGRDTGDDGFALAADYVVSLFKMWGIKPGGDQPSRGYMRMGGMRGGAPQPPPERSYFQEFALRQTLDVQVSLDLEVRKDNMVKTRSFESGVDFMGMGSSDETVSAPVVFIGYGIQEKSIGWDELKNINIKDKIVLVLSEAPGKDNPESPFQKNKELKDKYFPPGGQQMRFMRRRGGGRFNKTAELEKLGPAAILLVANTGSDADVYRSLTTVRRRSDDRPIINRPRIRLAIPGATSMLTTVSLTKDSGLYELTREMNEYVGLDLAIRESDLGVGSGGSDHASFARVEKPFVYYMAAMTSDYHQPSDSVEKVSGDLIAKISRMGYLTVFAFANK